MWGSCFRTTSVWTRRGALAWRANCVHCKLTMMSTHQLVSGSSWVRMELSILSVCASLCSSSFSWFSVQIRTHKRNKNTICEFLPETKYICLAWVYVAPYVWPKKIHICKQKPIHTRYAPASTDFLAPFVNFSFCAWSSADLICESKKNRIHSDGALTGRFKVQFYLAYLQELICCKHSDTDGVERHQREHVALVVVGFVLVALQLLLHQLLHLLHVLGGLGWTGGIHVDGLTSHCARACTCCFRNNMMSTKRGRDFESTVRTEAGFWKWCNFMRQSGILCNLGPHFLSATPLSYGIFKQWSAIAPQPRLTCTLP